jgi:hypothetical protein
MAGAVDDRLDVLEVGVDALQESQERAVYIRERQKEVHAAYLRAREVSRRPDARGVFRTVAVAKRYISESRSQLVRRPVSPSSSGLRTRRSVEFDREVDGRWIAEVCDPPGVMACGRTHKDALGWEGGVIKVRGRTSARPAPRD